MKARTALRSTVFRTTTALLAFSVGTVAVVGTAVATQPSNRFDDGDQPGAGLSVLETLLIFVGIPLLAFVVITLLVNASSSSRGPRYRPGLGWWAAPIWFNGPDDAERAVRDAAGSSSQGGGASARW